MLCEGRKGGCATMVVKLPAKSVRSTHHPAHVIQLPHWVLHFLLGTLGVPQHCQAKTSRDFATADRVRDELKERGISIWESNGERRWRAKDGRSGSLPSPRGMW